MEPIVWSVLLLVLGLALVVLEVFVPSAGLISCLSALAVIGSIVVAFLESVVHGVVMLTITSVLLPVVITAAFRWWPHTPIGRMVLIAPPEHPDDVLPDSEEYRGLRGLIGEYGVARSTMLPSGSVRIANRTYDAISEGMPVDAGQRVKVMDVRTNRIVVRPVADKEKLPERSAPEDVLLRPLDSLGLEDPLA